LLGGAVNPLSLARVVPGIVARLSEDVGFGELKYGPATAARRAANVLLTVLTILIAMTLPQCEQPKRAEWD
jgi:hypothetical protein